MLKYTGWNAKQSLETKLHTHLIVLDSYLNASEFKERNQHNAV